MTQFSGRGSRHREPPAVTVNASVRVYPGTSRETRGVVAEDFGADSGQPVDIGDRIVAAARRWAVLLADGGLVFVDDADVAPV
jgi:hypothetical protein